MTRFKRLQNCAKLIVALQAVTSCSSASSLEELSHTYPLNEINVIAFGNASLAMGIDWLHEPKNPEVAETILVANILGTMLNLAVKTYEVVLTCSEGFFDGARPNADGIKPVLALQYGVPHKELSDPFGCLDVTYADRADLPS